jgi:hypothetical protein
MDRTRAALDLPAEENAHRKFTHNDGKLGFGNFFGRQTPFTSGTRTTFDKTVRVLVQTGFVISSEGRYHTGSACKTFARGELWQKIENQQSHIFLEIPNGTSDI